MEIAKYLLSSDSKMKTRSGVLNGRRVDYFKGYYKKKIIKIT